jgi:hypothetical protein
MERKMNIYLITDDTNDMSYEYYDSAVVIAETETEAQKIHPNGSAVVGDINNRHNFDSDSWTNNPYDVKVKYLGRLEPYLIKEFPKKIICASFNAG